ncbi:hypothetical protein [Aliidiomarina sp. B3213]|nr:hypothetical protein [Aliidiomarina sp. B3213]RTE86735.1 hypothetical protein DQX04_09310 [Aliidiomarina sp. B3213]
MEFSRLYPAIGASMRAHAYLIYGGSSYVAWLRELSKKMLEITPDLTTAEQHYTLCLVQVHAYENLPNRICFKAGMVANQSEEVRETAAELYQYPVSVADGLLQDAIASQNLREDKVTATAEVLVRSPQLNLKDIPTTWLCHLSWHCFFAVYSHALTDLLVYGAQQGWLKSSKVNGLNNQVTSANALAERYLLLSEFERMMAATWYQDIMLVQDKKPNNPFASVDVSQLLFTTDLGKRVLSIASQNFEHEDLFVDLAPKFATTEPFECLARLGGHHSNMYWLWNDVASKPMNLGKVISQCCAFALGLQELTSKSPEMPWFHDSDIPRSSFVGEFCKTINSLGISITPETLYKAHLALSKRIETEYTNTQLAYQKRFLYPYSPWYELHF